ncbi:MAG: hypothetical protein GY852_06100 [bacterium]|nr:hypothetical protein [bacterium]
MTIREKEKKRSMRIPAMAILGLAIMLVGIFTSLYPADYGVMAGAIIWIFTGVTGNYLKIKEKKKEEE